MTQPQHLVALQRGNRVRLERARIKRELKELPRVEAMAVLADILEAPPECCLRAEPLEFLLAMRLMGRHFALRWLRKAGVSEGRRIGELTERQRLCLAELLRANDGARVAA